MVWKTNFDQIPYQEILESRQQKSTSILGANNNNNKHSASKGGSKDDQFEIHAAKSNTNRNERDTSPLTIQTNDEIVHDLDHVTSPQKGNLHQSRIANKKLAVNTNIISNSANGSLKPNNVDNNNAIPNNIASTLQHMVQQLDILTQVNFKKFF